MNPLFTVFIVLQAISFALTALILLKYVQEQKNRRHVFSLLGHNGFTEHLVRGKLLAVAYILSTVTIAVVGVFFLYNLNAV